MNVLSDYDLYENSYVKIRFIGEGLDTRGIPIYDLGQSFIAFQRIINKAYLFKNQKLTKGMVLSAEERRTCALQMIARQKESDGYGLSPFLTDPVYGDVIKGLIVVGVAAIAAYTKKKLFPPKENNPSNQMLIGSIKNEVNIFVDRIGNISGANNIQISPGKDLDFETLNIDKETKEYVRGLVFDSLHGKITKIYGVVTRIHPQRMTIDIKDRSNHYITVHLTETDFDTIRKSKNLANYIKFTGHPIFRFDFETPDFDEFEAIKIEITDEES